MSKEFKNIKVIGFAGQGKTTLMNQAIEDSINRGDRVIVVDTSDEKVTEYPINSFTINGERYVPIEKEPKKMSRKTAAFLGMTAAMVDLNGIIDSHFRQLPKGVNIIKEYGLIQLKKSTLSSWERNAVVRTFENNYKKVE